MDEAKQQSFKLPTTMPTSGQGKAKNNKMPMPSSTPSSAQSLDTEGSLPRQIINQIPLDFKKLKDAGLHRKLAVALSKQNVPGTKTIASETTKASPSNSVILPTAAPTNATTPATHTQTRIQGKQQCEEQNGIKNTLTFNISFFFIIKIRILKNYDGYFVKMISLDMSLCSRVSRAIRLFVGGAAA